jgi:hypothetical protein
MKTFLKIMREIKENGKYVQKFNNKFHKREFVRDCFKYEEMINKCIAAGVTQKLLGEHSFESFVGIQVKSVNQLYGIKSSI